jgi:tetratricopeptide (TPR) repeat protein
MTDKPEFDEAAAHKYFSANCFNKAWGLIDKADRTPEEDQQMVRLNQASTWHWTQREDCTDKNMSIGYWQASRIYALLGQSENARDYGQLSLDYSKDQAPFYGGYAHEALARAEWAAGNREKAEEHLRQAHLMAGEIKEPDDKRVLEADLETIRQGAS